MKILLAIIMSFLACEASAQTTVLHRKNVTEKEQIEIRNRYAATPDKNSTDALFARLGLVIKSSLPQNPKVGMGLMTQIYVNEQGTVDYVLFDLENIIRYNADSLINTLRDSLFNAFSNYKLKTKPAAPFALITFNAIGKQVMRREFRTSDSSIVQLQDALAATDTLKVKRLDLNQLELKEVPTVIYRFPNLEELYLGKNEIEAASIDMARLPRLKQLHMQGNQLTNQSFKISGNKSLDVLNLNENRFTDIPDVARNCYKMSSLWLGGNALTALSNRSFKKLKQVRDLNFYRSSVVILPKGIKKMRNLQVLDLYYNQMEVLPKSIIRLRKLTHLAIANNNLTYLPKKINKLKNVHTLYAHHNRLSKLPESIVKMQKLKILDLGYNWFTNFPTELISFSGLEELDLSSNNFTDFPSQLLSIKKLDKLYLRGNPFVTDNAETKYGQQLGLLKSKNIEVFY